MGAGVPASRADMDMYLNRGAPFKNPGERFDSHPDS